MNYPLLWRIIRLARLVAAGKFIAAVVAADTAESSFCLTVGNLFSIRHSSIERIFKTLLGLLGLAVARYAGCLHHLLDIQGCRTSQGDVLLMRVVCCRVLMARWRVAI